MCGERGRGKLISFSSHGHGGQKCPPSLLDRPATGLERVACGLLETPDTARMKIGGQRLLSFEFLIAASGTYILMLFLPSSRNDDDLGWESWAMLLQLLMYDPSSLGEWRMALGISSFATLSLLIAVSPFLGNIWVKSLLAWAIVVSFSALATGCYLLLVSSEWSGLSVGGWFMVISPVLNFVGLLLARPQWLKKPGTSFPPERHFGS
jgi:hypothetical protein